ncbi:tripartite tricarboxylate transporter substrate-binding protein [Bradyrhizobium japonicum]
MDRRNFIAGCLGLPLLAQAGGSQAQAGLTKMIFPFAAGAGGDTLCRLIAQEMAPALQRTIVVENRTGGDGLIGIKAVKGASADGSMVLVTTGPTMYLLPMVETTPSFDTAKDFMPVSLLARFEFAARDRSGDRRCGFQVIRGVAEGAPGQDVVRRAEQRHHSAFRRLETGEGLGIPLSRVPYRGSAPILNDLVGGHLPFGITTLADALPQHRAKGVKIIAVASAERSPFAPEVPTLKESGIDLVADAWYGMWLPAGSSPDFASKLGAAASAALARPEVKEKLTAIGLIPVGSNADGLTTELAANTAFWQPIVKATGYKIEN